MGYIASAVVAVAVVAAAVLEEDERNENSVAVLH